MDHRTNHRRTEKTPTTNRDYYSVIKKLQINVTDLAVAKSGNYEKFAIINGKKYSHTIDPRTGLPVSGIKSVTIITLNAEIADAMATPVMVMGIKVGLDFINQMKDIEAIAIDGNNILYSSANIRFS